MLATGELTSAQLRALSPQERSEYVKKQWAPTAAVVKRYAENIVGAAQYADDLDKAKPLQLGRTLTVGEMHQALRNPGLKLEDPQGKLGMAFRDLGNVGGP